MWLYETARVIELEHINEPKSERAVYQLATLSTDHTIKLARQWTKDLKINITTEPTTRYRLEPHTPIIEFCNYVIR